MPLFKPCKLFVRKDPERSRIHQTTEWRSVTIHGFFTSSSGLDPNTVPRPSLTRNAKVLYDNAAAEKNELSLLTDEVTECRA